MDGQSFDAVVQRVAQVSSRRGVLRAGVGALVGSALGALAVTLGFTEAEATHFPCRHVGNRCKQASQCCSGICKRRKCRAHDTGICKAGQDTCVSPVGCGDGSAICLCVVTTGKASFCHLNGSLGGTCSRDEECVTAKGEGAACIVCGGVGQCAARCPAPD